MATLNKVGNSKVYFFLLFLRIRTIPKPAIATAAMMPMISPVFPVDFVSDTLETGLSDFFGVGTEVSGGIVGLAVTEVSGGPVGTF